MTMAKLPDQRFAPHFVESSPGHGDVVNQVPDTIMINFDFTLQSSSSIVVSKNGSPLDVGQTNITDDNLAMWVSLPGDAGEGVYSVEYRACWPDGSCHDGQFGFHVGDKAAMGMEEKENGDAMMGEKDDDAMMEKKDDDNMMGEKEVGDGDATPMVNLPTQQFAAHFVDSAPKHGQIFALVPQKVMINFDFTLHSTSTIELTMDGAPVDVGSVTFGPRSLSMSATLPNSVKSDGLYEVRYKACWPDTSCHDGLFAFTVDGETIASYIDMTGRAEVQIDMTNIKFETPAVVISKGTKVVWVNRDPVVHFVNTDPHPSHNFLLSLNSLEINPEDSYSFTFNDPGEWPYHCSLHYPSGMAGRIIVQ